MERKEEIRREGVEKGRGDAGLHRKWRGRPAVTAGLRAPIRAAWGRSEDVVGGKNEEEEEGYKRVAVVWAFALAVVRNQEGRSTGAGG